MLRIVQQRSVIAQFEAIRTSSRSATIISNRYLHSTTSLNALTKFTMPAMSPTMTEGGIASWKKKEGESFAPGDVLVEIETDKATMDVEAQDEGMLAKIIVGDGSKAVPVGSSIAILAEEGDDISPAAIEALLAESSSEEVPEVKQETAAPAPVETKAPEAPKEVTPPKSTSTPSSSTSSSSSSSSSTSSSSSSSTYMRASPMAKRLALEAGIPLSALKGTGPGGRIVKIDVESYTPPAPAPTPVAAAPSAPKSAAAPSSTSSFSSSSASASSSTASSSTAAYTDTPVSSMRRTIATRLTDSKSGTPHYYLTVEVNMDKVMKLRALFNGAAKAAEVAGGLKDGVKGGVKLSVNDFIVKASALALQDVPEANSGWHGEFVRHYHTQDISIAVATPNGLITPIVRNVGAKGLATVSAETKALALKARDGKLKPDEYQGGSFTISNLGMMGIESFTAIINPPQSCILAIGATEKKLVLDEESEKGFKEINIMKATMSCDHRVVDGAVGAKWMKAFKSYLESPLSFML